jgi:carboxylesterase
MTVTPGAEPWSFDGDDTGILLLHGFSGSPAAMRPWGERLAQQGWTVRVPRLPGHGLVEWKEANQTTWEDWYGEAERQFLDLRSRCRQVFVMGLSVGGALSLRLAQQQGDHVAGLVLVNPAVLSENKMLTLLPVLKHLVAGFPAATNDIAMPGKDEIAYPRMPLRALSSLTEFWKIVRDDMPRVTQPLVVFNSEQDHLIESSSTAYVLTHVASADKQSVVLMDSFHVATLDYDAEIIFSDSIEFVRRLSA